VQFLDDESCDFAVVTALRAAGHDVSAIAECNAGMEDERVLTSARSEHRVLITEDKNFGVLAYAGGHETAGVVLIRFPADSRSTLGQILERGSWRTSNPLPHASGAARCVAARDAAMRTRHRRGQHDLLDAAGHHIASERREAERPIAVAGHANQAAGARRLDPALDRSRRLVAQQAGRGQPREWRRQIIDHTGEHRHDLPPSVALARPRDPGENFPHQQVRRRINRRRAVAVAACAAWLPRRRIAEIPKDRRPQASGRIGIPHHAAQLGMLERLATRQFGGLKGDRRSSAVIAGAINQELVRPDIGVVPEQRGRGRPAIAPRSSDLR
jgi:predicted nuclease of predicted toxin-antitoxin system